MHILYHSFYVIIETEIKTLLNYKKKFDVENSLAIYPQGCPASGPQCQISEQNPLRDGHVSNGRMTANADKTVARVWWVSSDF